MNADPMPFDIVDLSVLCFLPLSLIAFGWRFFNKQNRGEWTGGPISVPKALWLAYTIHAWFFLPLLLLRWPTQSALNLTLWGHTLSWWSRGIIELSMIFKFYNWSPRYGITHDLLHVAGLTIGLVGFLTTTSLTTLSPQEVLVFAFLAVTIVMTVFEAAFAFLFRSIRGDADHKIYYADDNPKWRFVNRLTQTALVIGIGHLLAQILFVFNNVIP